MSGMVKQINDLKDDSRLVRRLKDQFLIYGNDEVATAVARVAEVLAVSKDNLLIRQGAVESDMYFILAGRFGVLKNGRQSAIRGLGCHVGEMSLIEPGAPRSADVVALEDSIVAKVTENEFSKLPQSAMLWRRIALGLSTRLREVTAQVSKRNEIPRLFIGSSTEALPYAEALSDGLECPELQVTVWNQDVFHPSHFALESLEDAAKEHDFAAFVFHPDDVIFSRKDFVDGPRDNVLLEAGIFMGAIGRMRTFILAPRGIKVPSDLFGFTTIRYTLPEIGAAPTVPLEAIAAIHSTVNKLKSK